MDQVNTGGAAPFEVVWGVAEISKLIGRTERQTFHLLSTGQLPAEKVGGRWATTKARLARHFEGAAAGSASLANG